MKGIKMYTQIKILKDDGFKKAQVARKLKISRNTVDKYWNMSLDEYEKLKLESAKRSSILDDYEDFILHLLNKHADYTSSQIHDLLIENYLADPETKGKTESVIDYAKNNFAKNREYINIELFNQI